MSKMSESDRLKSLEVEVQRLHTCLQQKGINTTGETDIFGREFHVPVDAEHVSVMPCAGASEFTQVSGMRAVDVPQ